MESISLQRTARPYNKMTLEQRNALKRKKPTFTRSDSHKKKRLKGKWRRPRGIQSKVRLKKKGYVRSVEIGWGSPKDAKHLTRDGFQEVMVYNISDLEGITDKQGIVIASSVGARKKIEILKIAIEKKFKVINVKDPAGFINKVEEKISSKKQEKKKKEEIKEKKTKEKKKKAEEKKEDISDKVDEEEKKEQEKKDKDKMLIKKGSI